MVEKTRGNSSDAPDQANPGDQSARATPAWTAGSDGQWEAAQSDAQAAMTGHDELNAGEDDDDGLDDTPDAPGGKRSTIDALAHQEELATVEAILFASDSPLPPGRIAQVAELRGAAAVKHAVRELNHRYEQAGSAFRIEQIGGGYQMLTLGQYHDVLGRLFKARGDSKLSQAAMETLAIIAYRQPILRADIESIRGVATGDVIRTLMERQLVKIIGRAEVLGRPMLYGTTKRFLEVFGLASLEDLPNVQELRAGNAPAPSKPAAAAPGAQPPVDATAAPADASQEPTGTQPPADAEPPAPQEDSPTAS